MNHPPTTQEPDTEARETLRRANAALEIARVFITALPIPTRGATGALIQMEEALRVPASSPPPTPVAGTGLEEVREKIALIVNPQWMEKRSDGSYCWPSLAAKALAKADAILALSPTPYVEGEGSDDTWKADNPSMGLWVAGLLKLLQPHGDLRAVDTADYAEVFDAHGEKVALTTRPTLILALNSLRGFLELHGRRLSGLAAPNPAVEPTREVAMPFEPAEATLRAIEFAIYRYSDCGVRDAERGAPHVYSAIVAALLTPPAQSSALLGGEGIERPSSATT